MADAYPAICFNVSGTKIWGAADAVELSAGIWPNVVALHVPKHEFSKLSGDYNRQGNLQLYFSNPTTPDVTLTGWSIDHVGDSITGKLVGQAKEVVEKVLYLTDRRWEFLDGRGGHLFKGLVNQTTPDGKGVFNQGNGLAASGITYFTAINALQARMQYASGLARFSNDLIPPEMNTDLPKPRDLKWDGVHCPSEMQRVLEEAEGVWILKTAGTYDIDMLGTGDLPTLPAEKLLPGDSNNGRNTRPETVVITSAPQRAICQQTVTGISTSGWEYVGIDTDGSLKPLANLSYVIASGKTAQALVRENFASLSNEAFQLAAQSLFSMIRLAGSSRANKLPILTRTSEVAEDADGTDRPLPVRVAAKVAQHKNGRYYNSTALCGLQGYKVDPVNGVIIFPGLLGKVSDDGVVHFRAKFVALGSGDLEVTFSHESHENLTGETPKPWLDYWAFAFTHNAGGTVIDADLDAAMSPSAQDVRILRLPELIEFRKWDDESSLWESLNIVELYDDSKKVAGRILKDPEAVKTYHYIGFHSVSPNGNIPSVRWDFRKCTTTFDYRTYFIGRNRYADKKNLFLAGRKASSAAATAGDAPRQVKNGGRDYAPPPIETPGRWQIEGQEGRLVSFGKISAVPTLSSPLITSIHPCDIDGSNEDTGTTISIYHRWKHSIANADAAPLPQFAVGEVIAYVPLDGTKGVLAGDWILPKGVAEGDKNALVYYGNDGKLKKLDPPDTDHKLLQRKADDSIGWDWGRGHG